MRVIDLSTLSMVGGSGVAETKVPLWWSDGQSLSRSSATGLFLIDGGGFTASPFELFFLGSNWYQDIQYAFEITAWLSSTSNTADMKIYDITSSSVVSLSEITLTSQISATVIRSGKFTLLPSHAYGVQLDAPNSTPTLSITDASLITFPQ